MHHQIIDPNFKMPPMTTPPRKPAGSPVRAAPTPATRSRKRPAYEAESEVELYEIDDSSPSKRARMDGRLESARRAPVDDESVVQKVKCLRCAKEIQK